MKINLNPPRETIPIRFIPLPGESFSVWESRCYDHRNTGPTGHICMWCFKDYGIGRSDDYVYAGSFCREHASIYAISSSPWREQMKKLYRNNGRINED